MADKATSLITASILPNDIKSAFNGKYSFNPVSASYKWVYSEKTLTNSSTALFSTSNVYIGTTTAVSMSDKLLWIAVKNTGTTDGSTPTTHGVILSIDAGTAVYNLADGIFIDAKELFIAKLPNTILTNFTAITVTVSSGLPTSAGTGNVQLQIAGILHDVA